MIRNIIITLIALLNTVALIAVNRVEVPDTIVYRGVDNRVSIRIKGSLDVSNADSVRIRFTYRSDLLEIREAIGGNNFIFGNDEPQTDKDFTVVTNAVLDVKDSKIIANGTDGYFDLIIEGLAGPDSIAYLLPSQIFINGSEAELSAKQGTIIVRGAPVFLVPWEGIGQNYPNPFSNMTKVVFSLKFDSPIEFKVFTYLGESIKVGNNDADNIKFKVSTINGNPIDPVPGYIYEKGEYILEINPDYYSFSSGPYFLQMVTRTGVYSNSMMFLK